MFFQSLFFTLLLSAVSVLGVYVPAQRHPTTSTNHSDSNAIEKRFDNARFTFYDAGLGACGKVNSNSDFIVALNVEQWNGGSHCWQMITISYGGKTTQAQITDLCPSCPYGALDLSRGLFDFFASEDLGVLSGHWDFSGGNLDGGNQQQQQQTTQEAPPPPPSTTSKAPETPTTHEQPTTTHEQPPPTTHEQQQPTTTHEQQPTSTSTTKPTTSSQQSTSAPTTSASATSSSSSQSPTSSASFAPLDSEKGTLFELVAALVELGGLVLAGATATATATQTL